MAPLSPVLSSRVAVQVRRYDPNSRVVGRETVALFQRHAHIKGAERAILVTLGKYAAPAHEVAISATPTVDLIDGERFATWDLEKELGVRLMPIVNEAWLDRFGCISAEPVAERWEKERALTVSPSAALRAGMPPPASHPHGRHRVVSWVGRHASESGA